jgi:hypothetical protein
MCACVRACVLCIYVVVESIGEERIEKRVAHIEVENIATMEAPSVTLVLGQNEADIVGAVFELEKEKRQEERRVREVRR